MLRGISSYIFFASEPSRFTSIVRRDLNLEWTKQLMLRPPSSHNRVFVFKFWRFEYNVATANKPATAWDGQDNPFKFIQRELNLVSFR